METEKKNYTIGDEVYTLHYSLGRLEQIEQATGCSAMSVVLNAATKQQLMPLNLLKAFFAYGMLSAGGVYAPVKKAMEFAQKHLETAGYIPMLNAVLEQMETDCGFLFLTD